jgi:hypothetical protein
VTLYHYTCSHGHAALGEGHAFVKSIAQLKGPMGVRYWTGEFAWFTDMATPERDALGLTSRVLTCDRTRHRYRITDDRSVFRWLHPMIRSGLDREWIDELESAPGARPRHWFVAVRPVPVVYDPREAS